MAFSTQQVTIHIDENILPGNTYSLTLEPHWFPVRLLCFYCNDDTNENKQTKKIRPHIRHHLCKICFTMLHIWGHDLFYRDTGIWNSFLSFVNHTETMTVFAHGSFFFSILCLFALRGLTFFLLHISILLNYSCLTRM